MRSPMLILLLLSILALAAGFSTVIPDGRAPCGPRRSGGCNSGSFKALFQLLQSLTKPSPVEPGSGVAEIIAPINPGLQLISQDQADAINNLISG
eukprot:6191889-Pleurochrysis_carterae.AAC.1